MTAATYSQPSDDYDIYILLMHYRSCLFMIYGYSAIVTYDFCYSEFILVMVDESESHIFGFCAKMAATYLVLRFPLPDL